MPLLKSGSKAARNVNIKEMIDAGHPVKQAVAAGYSNQRKYLTKGDSTMKKSHAGKSAHHKKAEHHMEKAAHHHEKAKHHMEKAKHEGKEKKMAVKHKAKK